MGALLYSTTSYYIVSIVPNYKIYCCSSRFPSPLPFRPGWGNLLSAKSVQKKSARSGQGSGEDREGAEGRIVMSSLGYEWNRLCLHLR